MAAYNEITLPAWQNLVRRIFGLQGPGGNIPNLSPEIQCVAIVQPDAPEHRRLRGLDMFGAFGGQIGIVGGFPNLGFINPAGSGRLVVVELVQCQVTASGNDGILSMDTETNIMGRTLLTIPGSPGPRDSRMISPGAGLGVTVHRVGNPAANTGGFNLGIVRTDGGNTGILWSQRDIVLTPGFGLQFQSQLSGVAQIVRWTLTYYERVALPEELSA